MPLMQVLVNAVHGTKVKCSTIYITASFAGKCVDCTAVVDCDMT